MPGPDDPLHLERVAAALRVAGSPFRLRLLQALDRLPGRSAADLACIAGAPAALAAAELGRLRDHGLVTRGGSGYEPDPHVYTLAPEGRAVIGVVLAYQRRPGPGQAPEAIRPDLFGEAVTAIDREVA